MEERALALGGRLAVTSVPGEGTAVNLDSPLFERTEPPRS
jgi:signal transduction histidine kinase